MGVFEHKVECPVGKMAAEQGISLINIVPSIAVHDHIDLGQYMKVIVGFLSPDVFSTSSRSSTRMS